MSNGLDIEEQLRIRIQADVDAFNGDLPERYALAWHGYLAGVVEWTAISFDAYGRLLGLLPKISDPNPIDTIFLGRE